MRLSKLRTLCVSMLLLSAMAMSVLAYEYISAQQIPTGIVVKTPNVQLGIYWDSATTEPATTIDFGEMSQPNKQQRLSKELYIKNEGNVSIVVYWNSTLSSVTAEIEEWWSRDYVYWGTYALNGTTIQPSGDPLYTAYMIQIPAYTTAGTYNWTLTVWGEY